MEFIRAGNVQSQKVYVYDGMKIDWQRYRGYSMENMRNNQELGTESDPKVGVMREFKNSEANHLGMPLPKGRVRFYRQDDGKQLEFTGENVIDHTPEDETVRIYTGNAFDLVGERRRTDYKVDTSKHWLDESFEIKLRNHKKEPVDIRVVEHLSAGSLGTSPKNPTRFERRTADHRVPRPVKTRRREDDSLHGTLFVVRCRHIYC